ncbi:MAG: pentapeptide repeat-containing protein [Bacteroidota bacterium]
MRILILLLFVCGSFTLFAQQSIDASEVIAMIDDGKEVSLNNVTIKGDLDFTKVADRERDNNKNWGKQPSYRCHVRSRVSFTDCVFEGEVVGYLNTKDGKWNLGGDNGELYNADFHETVAFKACTFREKVNFKYTRFYEGADFSESRFGDPTVFKYTRFDEYANFSRVRMAQKVTFKYTGFPDGADFSYAQFSGDAVFKYVKFKRGVNMAHADFSGRADFKYSQFEGNVDITDTDWGRSPDFKYTQMNGRKFRGGKG